MPDVEGAQGVDRLANINEHMVLRSILVTVCLGRRIINILIGKLQEQLDLLEEQNRNTGIPTCSPDPAEPGNEIGRKACRDTQRNILTERQKQIQRKLTSMGPWGPCPMGYI